MGDYVIKLPDIGEGVAEAELVEWLVKKGQVVREDDPLAAVMTDKATVEIPSPVEGDVLWLGPEIGDVVAVGSPIIRLKVSGEGNISSDAADELSLIGKGETDNADHADTLETSSPKQVAITTIASKAGEESSRPVVASPAPTHASAERPIAPPSVRAKAASCGVDLRMVIGTGPAGRISHEDLDQYLASDGNGRAVTSGRQANTDVTEVRVVGLRRKIAEKVAASKSRIPHFSYIEEVDVTELEILRSKLNQQKSEIQPKLTLLPFLMQALVKATAEKPQMNALFDDDAGIVRQFGGVHIGIATQTDNGLVVPVVKHAETLNVWQCAEEVSQVSSAARQGSASPAQLSGSTITITSLGAIGGVATTPVINRPEVSIIGVNKIRVAPVWDGKEFCPRKVMNLSSSFDHRVIDGWDAALFIQRLKALLETPAMMFVEP